MPLAKHTSEIVIVGGGVIGLAVARALARRGVKDVLLLERGELGKEASYAAAGILAPQAEADESDEFFALAAASRDAYPAFAESLYAETGIDIELDSAGTLYLAFNSTDEQEIQDRFAWQTRAGLSVERLTRAEALQLEPNISAHVCSALRFPKDIQVENRLLVEALTSSCRHFEVTLVTNTLVHDLKIESGQLTGVQTSAGFISTDCVVIAGGAWTSKIKNLPAITIEPVRGQMLCFHGQQRIANHVLYSPRGYLVPRRDGRLLAGSTLEEVGFDSRVTDEGLQTVRSNALEISSLVQQLAVGEAWAGLRPRAADNLPVLGPCGEIKGLVYATGHYRNGILLAPITGDLIAETIISEESPPLLTPFSADRFGLDTVGASLRGRPWLRKRFSPVH